MTSNSGCGQLYRAILSLPVRTSFQLRKKELHGKSIISLVRHQISVEHLPKLPARPVPPALHGDLLQTDTGGAKFALLCKLARP